MKAKIIFPGGITIEAEGTPEEIRQIAKPESPPPFIPQIQEYPPFPTIIYGDRWWADTYTTEQIQAACAHEFPAIWYGTVPPSCRKCGMVAATTRFTLTSGNLSG